jgi:cytochrome c biogenesis protein CcmG/thiol:disulfide interchange protein DsbE
MIMLKNKFAWILVGFAALVLLLAAGLRLDPRDVPSPLVGKPAPAFDLPRLEPAAAHFSPAELRGQVWLLNVWSTWCVSCRQEHPVASGMRRRLVVPIVGLNYKEVRGDVDIDTQKLTPAAEDALARQRIDTWLRQHGNPYQLTVLDLDGRVGIDYGVYGVPETYVIDKAGVIRYKQTGPITPAVLRDTLEPLIAELQK